MSPEGAVQTVTAVHGVDVFTEGNGTRTLVFVHGWPDTWRLWDSTVAALKSDFRCVRFSLPGFDLTKSACAPSLAEMTAVIAAIVDAVSPGEPVTLVMHDWGCTWGYEFMARHPERVARAVAVDIGNHNHGAYLRSLKPVQKRAIFKYQFSLATAWWLGRYISGALGTWLTRRIARTIGCPAQGADLHWQKNYPYAMLWLGLKGGFKGAARVNPHCPFLYIYGARKPYMFHSPDWPAARAAIPGNQVKAFDTGHWVMLEQPAAFAACVRDWLLQPSHPTLAD